MQLSQILDKEEVPDNLAQAITREVRNARRRIKRRKPNLASDTLKRQAEKDAIARLLETTEQQLKNNESA